MEAQTSARSRAASSNVVADPCTAGAIGDAFALRIRKVNSTTERAPGAVHAMGV